MKNKIFFFLAWMICCFSAIHGQIQVSKEPNHKNEIENKFIRLLDVWIKPGDTTMFHIHSTPSLFLQFTNTVVCIQIKGKEWAKNKNKEGDASYRSFINDTLVHRVSNCDTIPFHVTDIELLSSYQPTAQLSPLPFPVLFENEKAIAYRLTASSFNKQIIKDRGPMIAELVAGTSVIFNNEKGKELTEIKAGKYLYIKPGASFYFTASGKNEINMVIFEIK